MIDEGWHCPAPDCDETRVVWADLRAHYDIQHFADEHLADDPDWWDPSLPRDLKQGRKALVFEARRLADELGRTPRCKEMSQRGRKGPKAYRNHFGSYYRGMQAAGLDLPSMVNVCECGEPVPQNKRADHLMDCPARDHLREVFADD